VHTEAAGSADSFWTGLGAVRRDAFESVSGFDAERFPRPAMEDIDLGRRLAAAGYRIRLDPAIRGTHLKRWTVAEMVRVDFAGRGLPWTRMLLEEGQPSASLNLSPRHRASAGASLLIVTALAARRPRLALAGLLALLGLNGRFYRLIWRRRGPGEALLAIPLHLIHHLTGVAAAASALVLHLLGPRRER
jgi:GT2 family glycosyltransferase